MENNNTVQNVVHGFKVFRPDWTCSPNGNTKQYTCPGKFEEESETVTVTFLSGGKRVVNVAIDSGTAMIRDIMANLGW